MAAEDFKKLSPEQLQKLARTINDAKTLTNQQAEIIETVIAGEIDIGKLRISYLKEYLDDYSRGLDLIARKHSALNDAFLILDQKINSGYKRVIAEGTKAVESLAKAAEDASRANQKTENTSGKKTSKPSENTEAIDEDRANKNQGTTKKGRTDDNSTHELLATLAQQKKNEGSEALKQNSQSKPGSTPQKKPADNAPAGSAILQKSNGQKKSGEAELDSTSIAQYIKNISQGQSSSQNAAAGMELAGVKQKPNKIGQWVSQPLNTTSIVDAINPDYDVAGSVQPELKANIAQSPVNAEPNFAVNAPSTEQVAATVEEQTRLYSDHAAKAAEIISLITGLELARYELERDEVTLVTDLLLSRFRELSETATHKPAVSADHKQTTEKVPDSTEKDFVDHITISAYDNLVAAIDGILAKLPVAETKESQNQVLTANSAADPLGDLLKSYKATAEALRKSAIDKLYYNNPMPSGQSNDGSLGAPQAPTGAAGTPPTPPSNPSGSGNNMPPPGEDVYSATPQAQLDSMNTIPLKDIQEDINTIFTAIKTGSVEAAMQALIAKDDASSATKEYLKYEELRARQLATEAENTKHLAKLKQDTDTLLLDLEAARRNELISQLNSVTLEQLTQIRKATQANLDVQKQLNTTNVSREFAATAEGVTLQEQLSAAKTLQDSVKTLEEQRLDYIVRKKLELERENGRKLNTDETARIIASANREFELSQDNLGKITKLREKLGDSYFEKERTYRRTLIALENAHLHDQETTEARMQAVRLERQMEAAEADLRAQKLLNSFRADQQYALANTEEFSDIRARETAAIALENALHELRKNQDEERAKLELESRLKNNGKLSIEESIRINKLLAEKYENEQEWLDRIDDYKRRAEQKAAKDKKKQEQQATDKAVADAVSFSGFDKYNSVADRLESLRELSKDAANAGMDKGIAKLTVAVKALSSLAQQLDSKIDEIASYKGAIDTRLQGSSNEKRLGSYWNQIVKDMSRVGAVNPYFKQETFANNIKELVNRGIAFDLEQRAFLMTIQEKIANTFNVADGTLLRLIRIQQEDSTAGRLGMEASLNAFLNEMYETTEYLSDVASSVRSSLEEMESLMSGAAATEVEYQVQKWLGSLYSVGMSQNAVNSISQALGQVASGQIDGLTNGGAGNLLIMAANDAGLSIADVLTNGIDASDTNKLMKATVNYLAEIAEASKDNNVVQQQLANVFGIKASDLRAATNLASKDSVDAVFGKSLTYENMLNSLFNMAGSMYSRTSLGEMMTNLWNNVQYSLAGSMASNPMSYFLYKTATLLDNTVGGIAVPALSVAGFGVDLETTVADLMRVGALGTGILGSVGSLVQGLTNSFSGQSMLKELGISQGNGLTITPRGGMFSDTDSANGDRWSASESGTLTGNASGSDIKNSTLQEAEDTKKQLMVEAKEEEEANQVNVLNTTVLKIYELLDDVAHGNSYFRVKVEGYGLTKASNSGGTLGGVNALANISDTSTGSSSSGAGSSYSGDGNFGTTTGSIDFGGWTTVL